MPIGSALICSKKIAVNKLYSPKLTTSPEDALKDNERNILRTQAINDINSSFFQGIMSPTWYTTIDTFFSLYSFDEDVMVALFRYCFDRNALNYNYIKKVADGWASNNIKTMNDLEVYYLKRDEFNDIKKAVSKKLGITKNLNQYEEAFIQKWTQDYNYSLDILEIAFKKTTGKSSLSFEYLDKIITDWHEKKLNTIDEITSYNQELKRKAKEIKAMKQSIAPNQIGLQKFFDDNNEYGNMDDYYTNL